MPWTGGRRDANHAPLPARSEAGSGSVIGLVASSGGIEALALMLVTAAAAVAVTSLEVFVAAAVANSGGDVEQKIRNNRKGIFCGTTSETR